MSDVPTADQLLDIRMDSGDTDDPPKQIFTDAELMRYWYRVRGAANEVQQHEATLALMGRYVLMAAAKLHDYKAGNSSENLSQVFDHLKDLYNQYKKSLDAALGTDADIALGIISGINNAPIPTDEYGSSTNFWSRPQSKSGGGPEFT